MIEITFYTLLWVIGIYFVREAYFVGVKKEIKRIKKINGKPYKQPRRFIQKIAITNFVAGTAIIVFAIAIPILKIQFGSWSHFLGGITLIKLAIEMRLASADET